MTLDDLPPMPPPPDGFIRAQDGGRPSLPDFKERVKAGADPAVVFAEAIAYHTARGDFDAYEQSPTYKWLRQRARKVQG